MSCDSCERIVQIYNSLESTGYYYDMLYKLSLVLGVFVSIAVVVWFLDVYLGVKIIATLSLTVLAVPLLYAVVYVTLMGSRRCFT